MNLHQPSRLPSLPTSSRSVTETKSFTFPGKEHPYVGFGVDWTRELNDALLYTAVARPLKPWWRALWPYDRYTLREAYRSATMQLYALGHLNLDVIHFSDLHEFHHHLRPELSYANVSLDDIAHPSDQPWAIIFPPQKPEVLWRHVVFATLLFDRLPHLRTSEMFNPIDIWQRLNHMSQEYLTILHRRSYALLKPKARLSEQRQLLLAFYERILCLMYEQSLQLPRYLQAVSERPLNGPADPILSDDGKSIAYDAEYHQALELRRRMYRSLLQWLVDRTVAQLDLLERRNKRS